MVTAVDGEIMNTTIATTNSESRRDIERFIKPRKSGFKKIFDGLPAAQKDASIQGTAYLTHTVVNNATYNVKACTDWCTTVEGCVFVNLYYEFNNYFLDHVFSEKSNLKCAAYGDIHTADEKLNFGGLASHPPVDNASVPLTYITRSSGWAVDTLVDPGTPDGYELVFGPTGGANNAAGYMGFAFIDRYDVNACAQLCNARGADPNGGGCAYFNIWRATVDGIPTTYTCSMYCLPTDESTALNFRAGLPPRDIPPGFTLCSDFCFATSYANWTGTSSASGTLDAAIFFFPPYAHTGHGSALLGAAPRRRRTPGHAHTRSAARDGGWRTVRGAVLRVLRVLGPGVRGRGTCGRAVERRKRVGGVRGFMEYTLVEVGVVGTGRDILAFVGGAAPAWSFIDDCKVFRRELRVAHMDTSPQCL
ncbi:hypothetical protein B0H14DRAFT_3104598 [Mycena olivaceomarginata]|nr:hypothetical protein B0H14DRAFT_3104598 [Mycena olivaceomarginata]